MKSLITFCILVFQITFLKTTFSSSNSYKLRLARVGSCDDSNTTYVMQEITVNEYNNQHYLTAIVDLVKDMPVANITVKIEYCNLSGENCEEFGKFTIKEVCKIVFMKNTFWSAAIDSITPRPDCPFVKKNKYIMNNATINMNDIVKVYPNVTKYYWKMQGVFNDMENKPVACAFGEGTAKLYE